MLRLVLSCQPSTATHLPKATLAAAAAAAQAAASWGSLLTWSSSSSSSTVLQQYQQQFLPLQPHVRSYVDGKIGADPDEVAELIESNIRRPSREEQDAQRATPRRLLTTRREALSLYREILRYSNLFVHRDEHGRMWRDVLRANARAEFEVARSEPDPELINRMIVTGRDAVQRIVDSYMRKRQRIIAEETERPQVPGM